MTNIILSTIVEEATTKFEPHADYLSNFFYVGKKDHTANLNSTTPLRHAKEKNDTEHHAKKHNILMLKAIAERVSKMPYQKMNSRIHHSSLTS